MKEILGKEIARRVKSGEVIGAGTGSTAEVALREIAKRIKDEKLVLSVVPTSYQTILLCGELGINCLSPLYEKELVWGFDGADEVDPDLRLIKGRGGALLEEKILAEKCAHFVVLVDESKLVKKLGERVAVPIEVIPSALGVVKRELIKLGAKTVTQRSSEAIYRSAITQNANFILDVTFPEINLDLEQRIKSITGVVESGIFNSQADEVLLVRAGKLSSLKRDKSAKVSENPL